MQNMLRTLSYAMLIASPLAFGIAACDDKQLEKTGEKIDKTLDNSDHTLERAGEEVDEAIGNKNDKADDAMDDVRDDLDKKN